MPEIDAVPAPRPRPKRENDDLTESDRFQFETVTPGRSSLA